MSKDMLMANKIKVMLHEILEIRHFTSSAFVMRIERKDLNFKAGQHICVGPPNGIHTREYSIYSGEHEPDIEILVKEVDNGLVSPSLKKLKKGGFVVVEEPMGYFTIDKGYPKNQPYVFIATGTGISPFHSFVKSHPDLNYKLLHGVRFGEEAYDKNTYDEDKYIVCTSRDDKGDYCGRVTDYLRNNNFEGGTQYFLCGNSSMIHDIYDILEHKGISTDNIHAEVYF